MSNWFNANALTYLSPIAERLHQELVTREVIHVDEVPCQVLHEEGKTSTSKSYIWVYLSGSDGKPPITLYDYRPGRSGDHPIEFLDGFTGMLHCDGYSAYGRIQDVVLACCMAHCRRKFYEAIPVERRKKLKLLDINSAQNINSPEIDEINSSKILPAEKGILFCNKLFFIEQQYNNLTAAERKVKSYVMARKNFLFHGTVDGANASAIVFSLVETARANNLNVFQYLYTLLLYMPDYKDEPAGIEMLLPWSDFIHENCSGITDTEKIKPETRGNLPL